MKVLMIIINKTVYLTFDVDGLDSSIMPATGTPEPGGLLWEDVLPIIKRVCQISNVVGARGNVNTLMNYLVDCVKNSTEISLWKYAERNLIDVDDVKFIVDDIIASKLENSVINIASRNSLSVVNIVEEIEGFLGVDAKVDLINKGNSLNIDTSLISLSLDKIEDIKGVGLQYISNLLKKYY